MKFRTEIPLRRLPELVQINYKSKTVFLGSCFSTNVGEKCNYFKFQNVVNPFGVLFHPIAIAKLMHRALNNKCFTEEELIYNNGVYCCFQVHSNFSSPDKMELLNKLNETLEQFRNVLSEASHIIITLGTSWVYEHIATQAIVANCHKVPQKQFNKKLLSSSEITSVIQSMIQEVFEVNKQVQFIFTVSPVRHIKDGVVENQLSKAHLISAIHNLLHKHKTNNLTYFPSYEIMMDDLRDYRFYKEDMIHPNQVAIDYIWEQFKTSWISNEALVIMSKVADIQRGLSHKPFNPKSEAHKKFIEKLAQKKQELEEQVPEIKF